MELKATAYSVDNRIATITLNRPHRLNAWTGRMHTEYRWCLEQAEENSEVRCIVVTGAGRGFCAGADSRALDGHIEKGGYDSGTDADELANPGYGVRPEFDTNLAYHFGLSKPVVAAINGPAAGVGLVLACYADIRFAVPGAKLTTAHGRLGLPAAFGLSWLLPRLIGLSRPQELMLSSRVFLSDEAAELGLVHRLVEPDGLLPAVYEYARAFTHGLAPSSIRATRHQVYTDLHRDVGSAVVESEMLLNQMTTSHEYREGVRALLEKREPNF